MKKVIEIGEKQLDARDRHLEAVRKYKQGNRDKVRYQDARAAARTFINPQPGTKKFETIAWAGAQYYDDLRDLKARIEQRLKDQEEEHHEEGK